MGERLPCYSCGSLEKPDRSLYDTEDTCPGCGFFPLKQIDIERLRVEPAFVALQQRTEAAEAKLAEMEKFQVQLAGCLTAADGATSDQHIAKQGDYGRSLAYQRVLEVRIDRDSLAAQVSALKEALTAISEGHEYCLNCGYHGDEGDEWAYAKDDHSGEYDLNCYECGCGLISSEPKEIAEAALTPPSKEASDFKLTQGTAAVLYEGRTDAKRMPLPPPPEKL